MTQADRSRVHQRGTTTATPARQQHRGWELGSMLSGGGDDADAEHAGGLGQHGRRLRRPRAGDAAADPARSTASTPCTATTTCRAPRSSRTTSGSAPPATRRSPSRRARSPRTETRATGPQWALRAVHLRGPRRPLGPHLRVVRRGPGAGQPDGDRASTASRARTRPRQGRDQHVLATAKHFAGDGVTTYGTGDERLHDRPGRRPGDATQFAQLALAPVHHRPCRSHHIGAIMPSYSSVQTRRPGQRPDEDDAPTGT